MLYHNVFVPHYVPAIYVPPSKIRKKKKKKTKFSLYAVPYKKKRYSFAYYLKYVLWKKLRRLWKKRKTRGKKKKPHKPSSISVLSNKGSEEKIDLRDFWGSKYGSQWLFAKQKQQHQQKVDRHHIIEIIDAFKTKDLKYANRHPSQRPKEASFQHALPENTGRKSVDQSSRKSSKCPCCRRSRQTKEWADNDSSDWSLSTVRCQQRPCSKWPPNIPPGAKHLCGKEEQFTTILSRQHAYLYNWLNVDQSQSRCKLTMSKEYLDKVRMRIDGSRPSSRRRRSSGSQVSCSCSESGSCSSTLSRRERAKIIKRQRKAKEKAAILWLLSKAFGGRIPSDLKEPFYRDHDNVRRLKPKIVHSLANAELYCLALVNIYSDPNYNNLDHQGIIQALMRKGICLVESREAPLTETTLVQTAPIRLNAHLSVIDGIMCLFIKEVLIPEKIVEVCRQFASVDVNSEMPSNAEEAAVLWINKCCKTLEKEIRSECSPEEEKKLPKIPVLQEVADISDGCCLAAVISYYCPNYLRWHDIVWNDPMSLGDSIHNLQLIKKFCCECLPCEINFLTLEDLLYLHPSIKENVLAFVSDLLFMFVITKVSCVSRKKEIVPKEPSRIPLENSKSLSNFPSHKSQALCSPIPNLRSDSYGGSTSSLPDIRPGSRTRTFGSKEKLIEKVNIKKSNLSNEELGPNQLQRTSSVGVVNGWKTPNLPSVGSTNSVSGSPRHTNSEISRPTVEGESASSNFSQPSVSTEDINAAKHSHFTRNNFVGLNSPQREQVYGLRKNSEGFLSSGENNVINSDLRKGRKSLEDYYNQLAGVDGPLRSISASNITENKGWRNCEKFSPKSHGGESVPESASSQSSGICCDVDSKHNFSTTSFAQLSKLKDGSSSSINIVYMNQEKDGQHSTNSPSTPVKKFEGESKKTTFAMLPNTTTWQQQHAASSTSNFPQTDSGHETPTEPVDNMLNAQLCNIKMKLEEKKRKIELKKKRMELLWKKQRQKLGQAAFLQAVSKNPKAEAGTPDSGTGKEVGEVEFPSVSLPVIKSSATLVKKMSMQDIAEDLDNVQKKWLNQTDATEQLSLPDTTDLSLDVGVSFDDTVNIDLQTSIEHLNTSLTDLQADISRICLQQEQVESLMKDSIDDASHFFLHGQSSNNSQFNSSPSKGPLHWQFNDSSFSFSKGGYSELDSKDFSSFLSSPQRQENNSQFSNQFKMSSFASLPPCPPTNKPKVAEELYSKVIKPENRQKVQSNIRTTASSPCKVPPSKPVGSSEVSSKPVQPKKSAEIHIVLPQVPDNKCSDVNAGKKTKDVLYIPIEKEVKKTKSKTLKSVKPASDILSVPNSVNVPNEVSEDTNSFGFVIGADLVHPDPETETEMARKKEMIMNLSIQRKAEYERRRAQKEQEYAKLKEEEQRKQEYLEKKREEEKKRREAILEQYRQRKLQEELEKEGVLPHKETGKFTKHRASVYQVKKNDNRLSMNFTKPVVELRNQLTSLKQNGNRKEGRPRPRSAYVPMNSDLSSLISLDNAANKRNSHVFQGREMQEFDLDSLNSASTSASSHDRPRSPTNSFPHHRNTNLQIPEGSNPSSDGASDTASNGSSAAAIDYTGPKLFVKPTAKSNRGIIVNAINTVLAGAVNAETKKKVVEEINKSESKHFLILFRDAGCQFRALYTYNPEREEVIKLYGIGPKNVTDKMMDRFYKYNSGGKCFSEIQTKHLTVTIDAFTIPNSLWAGKKVIPPKKEFF